jgi:hypothetical protein
MPTTGSVVTFAAVESPFSRIRDRITDDFLNREEAKEVAGWSGTAVSVEPPFSVLYYLLSVCIKALSFTN